MKLLVERWLADNEVLRQVVTFPEPTAALAWGHAMAATMRTEGRLS